MELKILSTPLLHLLKELELHAPHVPTVTEYACGVTERVALYWYHPAPPHQDRSNPHPHPHHTTSAFTVAIQINVNN